MDKTYPEYYRELVGLISKLGQEIPGPMAGFRQLHKTSVTEGAVSSKVKELIALGIAVAARCEGCIAFHVHDSLRAGATRPEIMETIGVAVMMGGGPSLMYACEALKALEQFENEPKA